MMLAQSTQISIQAFHALLMRLDAFTFKAIIKLHDVSVELKDGSTQ